MESTTLAAESGTRLNSSGLSGCVVDYPNDRLVHELFVEQARTRPTAIAVIEGGESLSYAELDAQSNTLSLSLAAHGMKPGERVVLALGRGTKLLVAMLAVLKRGGVYVPLDPAMPRARKEFILRDCRARLVLAAEEDPTLTLDSTVRWINCTEEHAPPSGARSEQLCVGGSAESAAYVMYTSGSTGEPKGVVAPHRAITNLILAGDYAAIGNGDCIAHCSNPAFDAATFEVWGALLKGARLVVVPQTAVLQCQALQALMREHGVTVLFLTTALFNKHSHDMPTMFVGLRYALFGGEAADVTHVRRAQRAAPHVRFVNLYGPTETTTFATFHPVAPLTEDCRSIPIGRPIANVQIHLLDTEAQPVPVGAAGEIWIGGNGVGLGYLHQPVLTRQRFVRDGFSHKAGALLYRTGDLGRYDADGNIEFLGRGDQQVKLRGFRIELGEIEAQLVRQSAVREAVVVATENVPGEKRLVAYLTLRDKQHAQSVAEIAQHLRTVLPEYMVPSAFVVLESLPLTANGKVDRRALPEPDIAAYNAAHYALPIGEVEQTLARIWEDLLRVERVGRGDNFFALGGHSLRVVEMLRRLRSAGFGVELQRVFDSPTLRHLAGHVSRETLPGTSVAPNLIPQGCKAITPEMLPLIRLEQTHIRYIVEQLPGGAENVQDIYPLAPLQEGMLFHYVLSDAGDNYVLGRLISLASQTELERFVSTLQQVVDRHDALRTAVLWEELPAPVQVVARQAKVCVEWIEVARGADPVEQIKQRMQPENQRIALERAPLLRVQAALEPRTGHCYALLQLHHVICDNESLAIVFEEVTALMGGKDADTLPQAVGYRSHVAQALEQLQTRDSDEFFRAKLADVSEPTAPFALLNVRGAARRVDEAHAVMDPSLARRVRSQAQRLGISPAILFHAAWAVVLARTSARADVVFGTVLLGRLTGSVGADHIVGMFINTLPLRLRLEKASVIELIQQTQRELVELLDHEQASLALAQRSSGIEGGAPLFTSVLNYRHKPAPTAEISEPLNGARMHASLTATHYPILVSIDHSGDTFELTADTDRKLSPQRILGYLQVALASLVEALVVNPQMTVLRAEILPQDERRQLLQAFSMSRPLPPRDERIHELFEDQVPRTPKEVAATYGGQSLTYSDLNRKANQLARRLRRLGVTCGKRVVICVQRGLDMLVGVLGILKSGGAYVPLDPDYPKERLAYMLEDAAPAVILTDQSSSARLADDSTRATLLLDAQWDSIATEDGLDLEVTETGASADELAYLIYTSGSTGKPKGVMVTHRNLVASTTARHLYYGNPGRFLLLSPLSFDSSVAGLFGTLTCGGTLIVASRAATRDPAVLLKEIRQNDVTMLLCVPTLYQQLLAAPGVALSDSSLLRVIVAGEACPSTLVAESFAQAPRVTVFNEYGPTEGTVWATVFQCDAQDRTGSVPIGRPIAGARVYVLDALGMPVPLGAPGEIFIGGCGVARGYHNRPELTRERFVENPFKGTTGSLSGGIAATESEYLYRTGDLGRWRPDGVLEYLGRNDDQVKLRGYRIELGEIEEQLARHPAVKHAVVVVREDMPGDKRLVAYLVPRADAAIGEGSLSATDEVRAYLKARLPEYMVPSRVVLLDKLPLSANGKLDRRAMPAPERLSGLLSADQEPQGETEQALASIWEVVLRIDHVGRQDDFFALGGHSLLAMQVIVRIRQRFALDVPVNSVFEFPQLADLAASIDQLNQEPVLDELAGGEAGTDADLVEDIRARVALLSDSEAQQLAQQLRTGGAQ